MDDFIESIKVIRLRNSKGYYLTAHEDKKSLSLRKPDADGSVSENTEWTVMWLGAGKCCLKSIYGKALTVRPLVLRSINGMVRTVQPFVVSENQEPWPVPDGAGDFYLQITNESSSAKEFQAKLIPVNHRSYSLESTSTAYNGFFLSSTTWPYFRSRPGWTVEVIRSEQKTKNESKQQLAGMLQVGQLVYNHVPDAAGGGHGGDVSHYIAGRNINGSGTQTNGNVDVHTEIGRQENVSVTFNNNLI